MPLNRLVDHIHKELAPLQETLCSLVMRAPDKDKAATHRIAAKLVGEAIHATNTALASPVVYDEKRSPEELQHLLSGLHTHGHKANLR